MQLFLRKEDICDSLSISLATVNNWIKTSVIPAPDFGDMYTESTYNEIISKIKKDGIKLSSRANRSQINNKYLRYLGIKEKSRRQLLEQIVGRFEDSELSIHEGVLALIIATLKSNKLFVENTTLYNKILTWIEDINSNPVRLSIFSDFTVVNLDDDFIGAFYQSIQGISAKSKIGSYYTPAELLTTIRADKNKSVIDPCCGSGGVLLKILSKDHNPSIIYARDIDIIALQICTANHAMFFNDPNLSANICYKDFLFDDSESNNEKFDYIITNPPWGSKFSNRQKNLLLGQYQAISTTEAFSIALYKATKLVSEKGSIYFFLPHSFLNVSTHKNIRKHILNTESQIEIKLLGNAFKGVLSEAILLKMKMINSALDHTIQVENKIGNKYSIERKTISEPDYIIAATSSNVDANILNKFFTSEYTTLAKETDFALGIVTGNNTKHILERRTDKSEPIFRGKDIVPYGYVDPVCFIEFKPETYQQVAPVKYFRTRKIVYRFICDKIICALDDSKSLILNSANLFIPNNYPMETIVCLFNSDIYTFIYRKKFHSTKLLKAHLQSMPLPNYSYEEHSKFLDFYSKIVNRRIKQEDIDFEICKYFRLTTEEYQYIREGISGTT